MPKITRTISSPNGLWQREVVTVSVDEGPLSAEDWAIFNELRALSKLTSEQRVLERLKGVRDQALKIYAEHGLPVEHGVYFEPEDGPCEYVCDSTPSPMNIGATAERREGRLTVWPHFKRIQKMTPPDFAQQVIILAESLLDELKAPVNPWVIAEKALSLLLPYHRLMTEGSDLAPSAVLGKKVSVATKVAAKANRRVAQVRRPLIGQIAEQALSEPGNSKKRSAKALAGLIFERVEPALAEAGFRKIGKDQLERDLRALGYKN